MANAAGKLPIESLCEALERTVASVEDAAALHGLSLACDTVQLVWCDRCATWRTSLNTRTGWCRVCSIREQLAGREDACREALTLITAKERALYEKTEAERQTRKLPPHPVKRFVSPTAQGQRSREEAAYLASVEDWEYRVLKLRYDAAKTRLRRMREKSGSNPRKASAG